MKYIQIFKNEPDARMKELYLDIRNGREEGLRPRSLDPYIKDVREHLPHLTFGEAWKYTEQLFWEEVAHRFFSTEKEK